MTVVESTRRILLTGATGYVGGRLLDALLENEHDVRCLARNAAALADRGIETVEGDIRDRATVDRALAGVDVAYYLVHSLGSGGDFADEERDGAETFAAAALAAAVGRVVYLGGLARGDDLSDHFTSRHEVGRILRESGVPTIEFRASVVIGAGSASFDLVRTLVERLPALVLPDWIDTHAQPIAIDDVVAYLVAAGVAPMDGSAVYEIGGADRITYRELIQETSNALGLQTPIVTLPALLPIPSVASLPEVLTDALPDRAIVWSKLAESLRYDSSVEDDTALRAFDVTPIGAREAVRAAV